MGKTIKIYNSLKREKEILEPIVPSQIKMYLCGPTVYDEPHIGHARSAYIFDVIRRYLIYRGYKVIFVRNVTDVDDKIIAKAIKEYKGEDLNSAVKKVAEKYLSAYHEALDALNISSNAPDVIEPKASEYIDKMIEFIKNLINRGVAYKSGGDVYFDITKANKYGQLSNRSLEKMEAGARVSPEKNKHNPLDFALWKSAKENEPSWDSPWGKGRPGWHIECSVMSSDILGDEFDIHGGGLDLIFPHHENEITQSEGAGNKFARVWIHHGLLTINGQKMAKSLGNFVTIKNFIEKYQNADLLKMFFLSAHYSHPIDYTEEKMEEAKKAYERFIILFQKIDRKFGSRDIAKLPTGSIGNIKLFKEAFYKAMDDDFNTPQALASIFDLVNIANKNMDDSGFIAAAGNTLKELLDIFGISLKIESKAIAITDEEIEAKILEREEARRNKDYKLADKIRKALELLGVILEDEAGTTHWRRKL